MALQQKAIQKLMRTLKDTQNSNSTELLNAAILSCRSRYHTVDEVVNECLYQLSVSNNYIDFLERKCGIVLDNQDTGALIGFDACGGNIQTAENIITEENISQWSMPPTQEVVYNRLKVIYPDLNNLNTDQSFIVGCLHTWWIKRAIHLIADSYGYEFNEPKATPKEIIVKFENGNPDTLAYVSTLMNNITGKIVQMELVINNNLYVNMDKNNPNGVSLTYPNITYLDRTIVHEFVHAVQATNIDFFHNLGNDYLWFVEGSSELVHGIDDDRIDNITQLMQNQNRFAQAFTQNPADVEDSYSAGYILLRYFARQVANGYTQKYRIKRHLMTEKGNVKSLKELGEKFIAFAQRSNNGVQAWDLASHGENWFKELSSFYGETLKVPMRNHADIMAKDKYYLFTSQIMEKPSGSVDINFIDVLKAQYQKINVVENYIMTGLRDVLTTINNLALTEPTHIIFSGCELDLAKGDSVTTVLNNIKSVVSAINTSGSRASLLLTPIPSMYDGEHISDKYKQFLNSSYIGRKINTICLGDNITSVSGNVSWVDYCQAKLSRTNIINKGVNADTTSLALARFDGDVVEQLADVCIILIGANDMWDAGTNEMATAKDNLQSIVNNCKSNNIVPIIVSYLPTLEQIYTYTNGGTSITPVQIQDNFKEYRIYCKELANTNDLIFIDNIYSVLLNYSTGSINKKYVETDLINLSDAGKKKVGEYIASKIEDFIFTKQNSLSQNYDIINLYDAFCKRLNTNELTLTQLNTLIDNERYKEGETYDYITEYIFGEGLLRPFNCPYFYVSLEHMNVDENTYTKWLRTSYSPGEAYKHSSAQFQFADVDVFYQSERFEHGSHQDRSLFKNTGEFVAFGVHTLYDENLWMCEQGGITCEKEAEQQVVDMNWMVKSQGVQAKLLPVFPGTGCPWLTISDENKKDYSVDYYGLDYWFTKSDYDATITMRINGLNNTDNYQSISLGMMTNIDDDSYLFPLYVAGGTEGISEEIYSYFPPNADTPVVITGNMYDLNFRRISMSNSNLLSPTKFNQSSVSNFKVLAPSGVWRDIFVYKQDAEVKPRPVCPPGRPTQFYYVLKEVELIGDEYDTIISECRNKIDTYTVNKLLNIYEHHSPLDYIIVNLNNELYWGESGCLGVLPNCYSGWYKTLPVGEVEIDNHKYLSIPNGWDKRLWYYPWKIGTYPMSKEDYDAEEMRKYWDDMLSLSTPKVMTHRLLIPLEEEGE